MVYELKEITKESLTNVLEEIEKRKGGKKKKEPCQAFWVLANCQMPLLLQQQKVSIFRLSLLIRILKKLRVLTLYM